MANVKSRRSSLESTSLLITKARHASLHCLIAQEIPCRRHKTNRDGLCHWPSPLRFGSEPSALCSRHPLVNSPRKTTDCKGLERREGSTFTCSKLHPFPDGLESHPCHVAAFSHRISPYPIPTFGKWTKTGNQSGKPGAGSIIRRPGLAPQPHFSSQSIARNAGFPSSPRTKYPKAFSSPSVFRTSGRHGTLPSSFLCPITFMP